MIFSLYFKNRDRSLLGYLFHIHGYNRIETDRADIVIGIENGNTVWRLVKNQPDAINDLIDMLNIVYFVQQFLRSFRILMKDILLIIIVIRNGVCI